MVGENIMHVFELNFDQWEKHGFSKHEAAKWGFRGFSLEEAIDWRDHGFQVKDAQFFKVDHKSPKEARELILKEIRREASV